MSMSTTSELTHILEINVGGNVHEVTFTADGKHLVSGSHKGVQGWRVKDGQLRATIPVERGTWCVATSGDGSLIAGGESNGGFAFVWDSTRNTQVFANKVGSNIQTIDLSPDSTHFVFADFQLHEAIIWDISRCRKVHTLNHFTVKLAKYSPQGDRIATASSESVRVWDSKDGRLLVDVKAGVAARHSLLWCDNYLFVITKDEEIKQIDSSTGSTVCKWLVPGVDSNSCIALIRHGKFVAYSVKKTITFLDTAANTRLGPLQHTDDIRSIACSADGQLLAIAVGSKIFIKTISSVPLESNVRIDSSFVVFHSISEPELDIDNAILDAWKHDQLRDAEALLSVEISTLDNNTHHVLASRALVRTRLGQWDAALVDANESLKTQRSLLAYVAKSVALVGKGEKDEGIRVCDIAFEHFHSQHVSLLLLIKAMVLFMAGDHVDAISRMNDLITDSAHVPVDPALYRVQAHMHLLHGSKRMESGDYEGAVRSFEDARIKLSGHTCQSPLIITLISGWNLDVLEITIQQRLCEALLAADRTQEAVECVMAMLDEEIIMTEPIATWFSGIKYRCRSKLEGLGDRAADANRYEEAIAQYTTALLLDSGTPQDLLIKRSRAFAKDGKWEGALNDAIEVIKLDPSSPLGYERKYTALLGLARHTDATDAFETMLLKMSESSDPEIRERAGHYVRPEKTMKMIRATIQNAIRNSPLVLIDTSSGRLCSKSEQAAAFESTIAFVTLVASITTNVDHALIEQVVREFYRYATFSHTWEGIEPLYETVIKTVVYDLEKFPTHNKLQMFCKIARDEGFNWAWSDTCCINKGDQFILQEALVSMFKWYEGSAMTIIFLCDVDRLAEVGAMIMSLWNSRGWTLQEYHASKVVRIYTKDWTPYLGLTIYNHKESPEIISEMEKATGISAQSLRALRPGLNDIREKLRLASTRQTTRVEDAAYSLLGIFSMTLPVTYGEGDKALGRLLSQLLTSSGDTSILAWTGISSSFNSCLPTEIVAYSEPLTSHIPPVILDAQMETDTAMLLALQLNLDLVTRLFDRVGELPTPTFSGQRMRLPCLAFKIRTISRFRNGSEVIFRAQASVVGAIDIKSRQNLAQLDSLYLIHPWIDFLLDRHAARNIAEIVPDEDEPSEPSGSPSSDSFPELSGISHADPLDDEESPPSPAVSLVEVQMEFLARLRQPFGALLLAPTRRNVPEFRRIATENVIMAQVQEITSATLNKLIQGVRILDVL